MEPVTSLEEPNWAGPAFGPPKRPLLKAVIWTCIAVGCLVALVIVAAHVTSMTGAAGGCGGA